MPRLLFAISAHGLGHLGQAAPVCNALVTQQPELELTLWSALPVDTLRQRIHVPFTHIDQACDIGFVMHDALSVDVPVSWQRYQDRERHWSTHLEAACALVRQQHPSLIISDVGDMPLAAGQALGIPTIAMSSLNWADMARTYFAKLPSSADILDRLTAIYDEATLSLRLSPGMPMRGQREQILPPVGALSMLSRPQIDIELTKALPYPDKPRILVGMGGIETTLPLEHWPIQDKYNLIVANQPALDADGDSVRGIVNADALREYHCWSFCDLLAGADAVICKPGYGTFVEAALAGVPVLYVKRSDWPEQPALIEWLHQNAHCTEIGMVDLQAGNFNSALAELMQRPKLPAIPRDGATIAAQAILSLLNSHT